MMSRSLTISQFQKITHEIALLFPNKNICMKNVGSFMPYQMQQFLDSFSDTLTQEKNLLEQEKVMNKSVQSLS